MGGAQELWQLCDRNIRMWLQTLRSIESCFVLAKYMRAETCDLDTRSSAFLLVLRILFWPVGCCWLSRNLYPVCFPCLLWVMRSTHSQQSCKILYCSLLTPLVEQHWQQLAAERQLRDSWWFMNENNENKAGWRHAKQNRISVAKWNQQSQPTTWWVEVKWLTKNWYH